MKIGLIISLVLWAVILSTFSGCAGSTGWRVSFGVAPVKSLDDHQGLEQAEVPHGKY